LWPTTSTFDPDGTVKEFVERLGARGSVDRDDGNLLTNDFLHFGIVIIGDENDSLVLAQTVGIQIGDQGAPE